MSTSIEDLTARAKQLVAERSYSEAVRQCRRVLLSRPEMVEVRLLLGEALLALRRYDEVRAEMMAVLRASASQGRAHRLIGEAHLREGNVAKATDALRRALELDPTDSEARELLSEVEEEEPPPKGTIDRWFDPEAVATIQTDLPPFSDDEEHTGQLRAVREVAPIEPPPRRDGALPAAPSPAAAARRPGHSVPPPPPSAPPTAGMAGAPARAEPPRDDEWFSETAAQPPAARANLDPDDTHELELGDIDEVERQLAEATPAQSAHDEADPFGHDPFRAAPDDYPAPDPMDYEQTNALPAITALPEEKTHARANGPVMGHFPMPQSAAPRPLPAAMQAPAGAPPAEPVEDHTPFHESAPTHVASQKRRGRPTDIVEREAPAPAPEAAQPPPSRKRMKARTVIIALTVPLVLAVVGAVGVLWWLERSAEEEIRVAAEAAGDDGLKSSLDRALALAEAHDDDDPEDLALRVLLLSLAMVEHGEDHREVAEGLLSRLEPEELTESVDARVGRAYLRLSSGDVDGALIEIRPIDVETPGPELLRARAQIHLAADEMDVALDAARAAAASRPDSPRHLSMLALLRAVSGDVSAARSTLSGAPNGDSSPWIRITRARVLFEGGGDPDGAVAEADVVLEELSQFASPPQKAWAHLIRARNALANRDNEAALEDASAAVGLRPLGDESFALLLAETFLRIGAPEAAGDVLGSLPTTTRMRQRRAGLDAEVALAGGDLEAAEQALQNAGESARTAYLRGRVAEERDDTEQARELYERAARDPRELVRANARLGRLEMEAGHAERAIELLSEARDRAPEDPEVVPLLVRAYLSERQVDEASGVITAALSRTPEVPELLAAKARVDLARGDVQGALTALRAVVERLPTDPAAQIDLGDAARAAAEYDTAQAAYSRALELRENYGLALGGLAELAVARGDVAAAEAAIARAEAIDGGLLAVARARAQLAVHRGDGVSAVEAVEARARDEQDPILWRSLGQLQWQGELFRGAITSFQRALELNPSDAEAHLGLAQAYIGAEQLRSAPREISRAGTAAESGVTPPGFAARLSAVRAQLRIGRGQTDEAGEMAREALEADENCGLAKLVLALIDIERGRDPSDNLRAALELPQPPGEVIGLLLIEGRPADDERCTLAARYMEVAPDGFDNRDVRAIADSCR